MLIPNNKRCVDCNDLLIDEFPEIDYIVCSGCPRIYQRRRNDKLE